MLVAAIALVMPAVAQAQDSPQRKELRRVDLSGAAGMEVISSISEFKPGDELPRHLHHGVEAGYVVQEQWCRTLGNRPRCLQPVRRSSIFAMWCMVGLRWSAPATLSSLRSTPSTKESPYTIGRSKLTLPHSKRWAARGAAMPVRIIGMIGVTPPSSDTSLHVIEGGLSPVYLAEFARAHDAAGFDMALVGYSSSSAEGFLVALYAAMQIERLGYLVAHRPGFVAPTLLAHKISTFDHLTGGRLAVH